MAIAGIIRTPFTSGMHSFDLVGLPPRPFPTWSQPQTRRPAISCKIGPMKAAGRNVGSLGDAGNAAVARGGSEGDETFLPRCRARPAVACSGPVLGSENPTLCAACILPSHPRTNPSIPAQPDPEAAILDDQPRSAARKQTKDLVPVTLHPEGARRRAQVHAIRGEDILEKSDCGQPL